MLILPDCLLRVIKTIGRAPVVKVSFYCALLKKAVSEEVCQSCKQATNDPQYVYNNIGRVVGMPPALAPRIDAKSKTIHYGPNGELPPLPVGYKRKSNDPQNPDARVFIPESPICGNIDLISAKSTKGCGCWRVTPVCKLTKIEIKDMEACKLCPNLTK